MKRPTPAFAVTLAAAALLLGAAVAWATTPPARGGHAVSVVPSPTGAVTAEPVIATGDAPVTPTVAVAPAAVTPVIVEARAMPTFTLVQTGNTVTLDASASPCHNGGCDYIWRAYGPTTNRLGMTVGYGAQVTFTPPSAGAWTIVLTQPEYCVPGGGTGLRSCPGVAQQAFTAA